MVEVILDAIITSLKTSIGACIMALLDGGLVILGVICIFLLSTEERHPSRQHKILRGYIITLLLANLLYLAIYFSWSHLPFIYGIDPTIGPSVTTALSYLHSMIPSVILGLTDGLLVRMNHLMTFAQTQYPRYGGVTEFKKSWEEGQMRVHEEVCSGLFLFAFGLLPLVRTRRTHLLTYP
jgi:hypothetical protein